MLSLTWLFVLLFGLRAAGALILRPYDLVNREYAGHSVPVLDFSPSYSLINRRSYVAGIWTSFFNYSRSNRTFYWGGCIRSDDRTYIYTTTAVEGPWTRLATLNECYYDAGLLIDEDDTIRVRSQQVYQASFTFEGARFYKRNGAYYIFLIRLRDARFILKSTSEPFGPYTLRSLLDRIAGPISNGGAPHQGGLVDTQNGDWYYMSFIDAYPGGRVPALAPITWDSSGWPVVSLVNGAWAPTGTDSFTGSALGHEWEMNHNPDCSRWSVGNGLPLSTATVTYDLYSARNTLTHRVLGPSSTATIILDYSDMRDGGRTGLALLRSSSAWVGIARDSGRCRVAISGITMTSTWATDGTGSYVGSSDLSSCTGRIWLRASADNRPQPAGVGRFSYSFDGDSFTPLGGTFTFKTDWQFFLGYRFGIFDYATSELGGSVTVSSFTVATP
ncbi:hypothetical protein AJ80_03714 [Polytolypa hystricis UAMH7299]|uniref:Beta-xylosidase C-terminal Concanavalin A-like domain-containing protein n=1 Tax=Polytolypa hystricis (strain UAMH7299) TaxID=1447883 RepID=A0A2B7Y7K8_POLH7|nr:hypothetical protein AJ80_03714 [Polytolypa hystricis UAMH7299]